MQTLYQKVIFHKNIGSFMFLDAFILIIINATVVVSIFRPSGFSNEKAKNIP